MGSCLRCQVSLPFEFTVVYLLTSVSVVSSVLMTHEGSFKVFVLTPDPDGFRDGCERIAFLQSVLYEDALIVVTWYVEVATKFLAPVSGLVPWEWFGVKVPVASGQMLIPARRTGVVGEDCAAWNDKGTCIETFCWYKVFFIIIPALGLFNIFPSSGSLKPARGKIHAQLNAWHIAVKYKI